jgi:hypothetical protein
MRSSLGVSLLGGLSLAGCLCNDAPRAQPARAAAASALPGAPSAAESALASRVCGLLQREPAERRAACCGSDGARHVAAECEQVLGSALERGALQIDGAALEACAEASAREQLGCAWVNPSQPLPPLACRALTQGGVSEGGSCHSSLECEVPLHCSGATPSESGRCAAPEPNGSACSSTTDALAAYLFAGALSASHPQCAGSCSLVARRCEAPRPVVAGEGARTSGQARTGEACRSDFDCRAGGCNAGQCGMKCSIALPERAQRGAPALAFRRLASRAAGE